MGHAFESQNEIGRLADEQIYRSDLAHRLHSSGLQCNQETPIELTHKTFSKTLYLDLVVSCGGVYELKTVSALNSQHVAQLLTYLYLLDLPRGKLVNFRSPTVESQFVNAPIPREERSGFTVIDEDFRGGPELSQMVVDLVRDWGTALSGPLYHQAIVCFLGGNERVENMLPLARGGITLANQRFHLSDNDSAFHLTTFTKLENDYGDQLQRLIDMSPLKCLHWINIGPHNLNLRTMA